jgi:exopolysaccharide biosynthesis WecB/TagA/CpsF family protein
MDVDLAIGVGALFDFVAGKVERAPNIMQKLKLEWAYRLLQEPRRLWRRYIIGNAVFIRNCFKEY